MKTNENSECQDKQKEGQAIKDIQLQNHVALNKSHAHITDS